MASGKTNKWLKISSQLQSLADQELSDRHARKETYVDEIPKASQLSKDKATQLSDYLFDFKKNWSDQQKNDILQKYLVVKGFYDFLVPDQVSEKEFWLRYGWRCNKSRIVKEFEALPKEELAKLVEKQSEADHKEKSRIYSLPQKKTHTLPAVLKSPVKSPKPIYDRSKLLKKKGPPPEQSIAKPTPSAISVNPVYQSVLKKKIQQTTDTVEESHIEMPPEQELTNALLANKETAAERPQDFLPSSQERITSPRQKSSPTKWGKPEKGDVTARPEDWIGSPSSAKQSWKVKALASELPLAVNLDQDDETHPDIDDARPPETTHHVQEANIQPSQTTISPVEGSKVLEAITSPINTPTSPAEPSDSTPLTTTVNTEMTPLPSSESPNATMGPTAPSITTTLLEDESSEVDKNESIQDTVEACLQTTNGANKSHVPSADGLTVLEERPQSHTATNDVEQSVAMTVEDAITTEDGATVEPDPLRQPQDSVTQSAKHELINDEDTVTNTAIDEHHVQQNDDSDADITKAFSYSPRVDHQPLEEQPPKDAKSISKFATLFPETTTPKSASRSMLVLVSKSFGTVAQRSNQDRSITTLMSKRIPFEEVDGSDPSLKDTRNELFAVSGVRGSYPQFFIKDGDTISFLGDYETFDQMNESGTLLSATEQPIDHIEANETNETNPSSEQSVTDKEPPGTHGLEPTQISPAFNRPIQHPQEIEYQIRDSTDQQTCAISTQDQDGSVPDSTNIPHIPDNNESSGMGDDIEQEKTLVAIPLVHEQETKHSDECSLSVVAASFDTDELESKNESSIGPLPRTVSEIEKTPIIPDKASLLTRLSNSILSPGTLSQIGSILDKKEKRKVGTRERLEPVHVDPPLSSPSGDADQNNTIIHAVAKTNPHTREPSSKQSEVMKIFSNALFSPGTYKKSLDMEKEAQKQLLKEKWKDLNLELEDVMDVQLETQDLLVKQSLATGRDTTNETDVGRDQESEISVDVLKCASEVLLSPDTFSKTLDMERQQQKNLLKEKLKELDLDLVDVVDDQEQTQQPIVKDVKEKLAIPILDECENSIKEHQETNVANAVSTEVQSKGTSGIFNKLRDSFSSIPKSTRQTTLDEEKERQMVLLREQLADLHDDIDMSMNSQRNFLDAKKSALCMEQMVLVTEVNQIETSDSPAPIQADVVPSENLAASHTHKVTDSSSENVDDARIEVTEKSVHGLVDIDSQKSPNATEQLNLTEKIVEIAEKTSHCVDILQGDPVGEQIQTMLEMPNETSGLDNKKSCQQMDEESRLEGKTIICDTKEDEQTATEVTDNTLLEPPQSEADKASDVESTKKATMENSTSRSNHDFQVTIGTPATQAEQTTDERMTVPSTMGEPTPDKEHSGVTKDADRNCTTEENQCLSQDSVTSEVSQAAITSPYITTDDVDQPTEVNVEASKTTGVLQYLPSTNVNLSETVTDINNIIDPDQVTEQKDDTIFTTKSVDTPHVPGCPSPEKETTMEGEPSEEVALSTQDDKSHESYLAQNGEGVLAVAPPTSAAQTASIPYEASISKPSNADSVVQVGSMVEAKSDTKVGSTEITATNEMEAPSSRRIDCNVKISEASIDNTVTDIKISPDDKKSGNEEYIKPDQDLSLAPSDTNNIKRTEENLSGEAQSIRKDIVEPTHISNGEMESTTFEPRFLENVSVDAMTSVTETEPLRGTKNKQEHSKTLLMEQQHVGDALCIANEYLSKSTDDESNVDVTGLVDHIQQDHDEIDSERQVDKTGFEQESQEAIFRSHNPVENQLTSTVITQKSYLHGDRDNPEEIQLHPRQHGNQPFMTPSKLDKESNTPTPSRRTPLEREQKRQRVRELVQRLDSTLQKCTSTS